MEKMESQIVMTAAEEFVAEGARATRGIDNPQEGKKLRHLLDE
jgi:hypothetical protein